MIITCPQCSTRFNLDESLITTESAKVQCSRCWHVFTVTHPEGPGLPSESPERPEPGPDLPDLDILGVETAPAAVQVEAVQPPPEAIDLSPPLVVKEAPVRPDSETPPPVAVTGEPPKKGRVAMLAILGGCLLGLLLGVLTLWYLGGKSTVLPRDRTTAKQPGETLTLPVPPASPEELRNLRVELLDARHQGLVHPKGGQLLVIQGEVINQTGEPRGPIHLKATLTDSLNQPVKELLFYSGTSLSDEELLQTDPEQIKRWLATPGGRLQRVLKPGASQPFTVVFFGAPDNLAEARFGFHIVVMEGPRVPAD